MIECVVCAAATELYLCPRCGDDFAADLAAIPDLCVELDFTRTRQDRIGPDTAGRRGSDVGLPWKEPAAVAAAALGTVLGVWAGVLAGQHGGTPPDATPELAVWLRHRLDWLRAHPAVGDAYTAVDAAVRAARRVVDRPAHRARFPVGPCPDTCDEGPCVGTVWAFIAVGDGESRLRCDTDPGHRWVPVQFYRAGIRIHARRQRLDHNAA